MVTIASYVALRKESVDRNHDDYLRLAKFEVALRKESVDRNRAFDCWQSTYGKSLSARRAWIEMPTFTTGLYSIRRVALRKESVDRNRSSNNSGYPASKSLSARRAWIEILVSPSTHTAASSRSPQGERG